MSQTPPISSLEIRHAACLATPEGSAARGGGDQGRLRVVADAAIRAEGGRIVFAGPEEQYKHVRGAPANVSIDARNATVLPGLVDAHTHPVWAGDRAAEFARRLAGASYAAIAKQGGGILATVEATRRAGAQELQRLTRMRFERMLRWGTTTVEAKSGYGLTVQDEMASLEVLERLGRELPLQIVPTVLAAHEIPPEFRADRKGWVREICEKVLPEVASRRLARFCDVFCEEGVFTVDESRVILERARGLGLGLRVHADELACSGGARLAAELGAASADHLLYVSEGDIERLCRAGCVAVLLPGTAWWLGGRRPPARSMIDAGLPVAIATDANPGSCNTESLPAVAAHACLDMAMTIEETITSMTINAAASLGLGEQIGSVEPGKRADLLLLDAPDYRHLIYHWGVSLVREVFIAGRPALLSEEPRA
jgi:imidazolonepropionase